MKISLLTLGCKTNLSESDRIRSVLLQGGHNMVSLKESPDICIVNTCTVTKKADYQCRQLIRRAVRTGARVIVTGCYSEILEKEIRAISEDIDIVKNRDKNKIINMIDSNNESFSLKINLSDRARPFVKIQEGCNFRCSYCVIHRARGRARSRPEAEIIEEIKGLEEEGFEEVVLTGTHIGLYGVDLPGGTGLSDLLRKILLCTKRVRLRLSSLEAKEIDGQILELLEEKRICPHLHLPLQSGDNRILSLMKRDYNIKEIEKKLKAIYKINRDINLGTDVIVGFPGEGDPEFRNTYNFLKEHGFNYFHIFPYSDRPGTEASMMGGKVPGDRKKERYNTLKGLDLQKRHEYRRAQVGSVLEVVSERPDREGMVRGKSANYLDVLFEDKEFRKSKTRKVKILKESRGLLLGIALNECISF